MNYLDELAYSIRYDFDTLDDEGYPKTPYTTKPLVISVAYPTHEEGYSKEIFHVGLKASTIARCCIDMAENIYRGTGRKRATFWLSLERRGAREYVFYTKMREVDGKVLVNIVLDPTQIIRTPAIKHFLDYLYDACKVRNEMLAQKSIAINKYPAVEIH